MTIDNRDYRTISHFNPPFRPRRSAIDIYAGMLIRRRCKELGLSQEDVGRQMRLSFQQIQKYENGNNRIGLGRLFDLCHVLQVEANYFFDNLPPEIAKQSYRQVG